MCKPNRFGGDRLLRRPRINLAGFGGDLVFSEFYLHNGM